MQYLFVVITNFYQIEFSQHPSIKENVTIITFGRDVKVLQYYSTDYTKISECVGNATSIEYCMFMIVHNFDIYKHKK